MAASNFSRTDRADSIYAVLMGDVDEFDRDLLIEDLAYLFSFINDLIVTDWGGNLESIIKEYLISY